ncbi:hypothetical protein [Streptomyces sp. NPDC086989]
MRQLLSIAAGQRCAAARLRGSAGGVICTTQEDYLQDLSVQKYQDQ